MNGYPYVGPAELTTGFTPGGSRIRSAADFARWVAKQTAAELAEPFTFVVDTHGSLRLAPRRSEHVVCAGGMPVLSAGEMSFHRSSRYWTVEDVSNQSSGYCPETSSWPAVAHALEQAGLGHPPGFTHEVVFRRCPVCHEHNIVREDDFVCVFCDSALPDDWNIG
jgi:hypothetical protein